MKIIFLDIDGVMNNEEQARLIYKRKAPFGSWSKTAVENLNLILQSTGAYIVVTSTWRRGRSVGELENIFTEQGVIPGRTLGKTPVMDGRKRGSEIAKFLKEHFINRISTFVIIDDDSDMEELISNLIQTDYRHGLTWDVAEKAIKILNGEAG